MALLLIAIAWFILLTLLSIWSDKHSFNFPDSGQHAPTTYHPHISHSILWGYLGCTFTLGPILAAATTHGGSLLICILGFWHLSRSLKLFNAYSKGINIIF